MQIFYFEIHNPFLLSQNYIYFIKFLLYLNIVKTIKLYTINLFFKIYSSKKVFLSKYMILLILLIIKLELRFIINSIQHQIFYLLYQIIKLESTLVMAMKDQIHIVLEIYYIIVYMEKLLVI